MNHPSGASPFQQKNGGSDKYFYEDLKNGYSENVMSPKINEQDSATPKQQANRDAAFSPRSELEYATPRLHENDALLSKEQQKKFTKEAAFIKIDDESHDNNNKKKISIMKQKSEFNIKKNSNTNSQTPTRKRSSLMNIFGLSRKSSTVEEKNENNEEKDPASQTNNANASENLSLLKKITMFFQKKKDEPTSSKVLNSLASLNSMKESQQLSSSENREGKETNQESIEKPPETEEEPVQNKIIYEEVEENEDEFDREMFNDQKVFENKLMRYQYYEHMKAVLNAVDENGPNNFLDLDSEEEEALKKEFELEGLAEYEKEYQKIANNIKTNQSSLYTEKKNDFEMIKMYSDPYPFLEMRKSLMFILSFISYICLKIIKNRTFETISLLVIIWNTIFLMIQDSIALSDTFDLVFLILYTIEMMFKIFGLGFILHKGSYLRDYWNILDFTIITTGYIPYLLNNDSSVNLSVLRSLRVLRPLRTISSIKSLRILLVTLFSAFPLIMNSVMVVMFFLLIFAIGGLQLLSGLAKKRCFNSITGLIQANNKDDPTFIGNLCGYDSCNEDEICGKLIENPNFNLISFDNIFYSFLNVFQCITLEGWTQIMFYYVRTFSIFMVFFFIPLVWVGAYFLVNLTLAVINTTFNQSISKKNDSKNEVEEEEKIVDENAITIEDIRNLKLGERSHHKRTLRSLAKAKLYGASEEEQQVDKNQFEIRWEDLFELKERIREEQERMEAEEAFKQMRMTELDKKEKIKDHRNKKSNLKYLPSIRQKVGLKDLQKKVIPLRIFVTKKTASSPQTKNSEEKEKKGVRFIGITGIAENGNETSMPQEKNLKTEIATNNKHEHRETLGGEKLNPRNSSRNSHKERFSSINKLALVEKPKEEPLNEEDQFIFYLQELPHDKKAAEITLVPNTNIFALKKSKNTKFFVSPSDVSSKKGKFLHNNPNTNPKFRNSTVVLPSELAFGSNKNSKNSIGFPNMQASTPFPTNKLVSLPQKKNSFRRQSTLDDGTAPNITKKKSVMLQRQSTLDSKETQNKKKSLQRKSTFEEKIKNAIPFAIDSSEEHHPKKSLFHKQSSEKKLLHKEDDHKQNSLGDPLKTPTIREHLAKKLKKDDSLLRIHDLDFSSSSISSKSSSSDESLLNDSDFNIGGFERGSPKSKKNKKTIGSIKEMLSKRSSLQQSLKETNNITDKRNSIMSKRKSKKTSIVFSNNSRKSRASKKIMSMVMQDLQKSVSQIEKEDSVDSDSSDENHSNGKQSSGHHHSKSPQKNDSVSNMNKIHINEESFVVNDPILKEQIKINEGVPMTSKNKHIEKLKKKGFFHKILTINSFKKKNPIEVGQNEEDFSPRTRRRKGLNAHGVAGNNNAVQVFQKSVLPKKKKYNVLHYKLMINHEKDYTSLSQEEVLEYRQEKEKIEREKLLEDKIKSIKYECIYTPKTFRVKKLSKQEKKKQKQLLKELNNSKKKSVDFQSLDNLNSLKKILNIKKETPQLPLKLRNNLLIIIQQQREILFGGRSRLEKSMTSNSPATNVSMISNASPLLRLQNKERERKKKKTKKNVEIDEKLTYEEWKVKIKEKLNDRIDKNEINEIFSTQKDFMAIREYDYEHREKRDMFKGKNINLKWSGEDVCKVSLKPNLEMTTFQKEKLNKRINRILFAISTRNFDKEVWLLGIKGKIRLFQKNLVHFVEGKVFENSMLISVVINTVILAMDGLFTDEATTNMFQSFNLSFTIIFAIEMGAKLLGYGFKGYFSDKMNIFDGIVVILSLVEVIVMSGSGTLSAFRSVRIFRTFRVLRVTRLLRSLQFMSVIIEAITSTIDSSFYVGLLLILFLVIYSMIGSQLFAGRLNNQGIGIRQNFDNFSDSFVVAFQLLTVENWNDVLTITMLSDVGAVLTCVYLISWIFLGNYVLLNLFLSILLSGFSKAKEIEEENIDPEEEAMRLEDEKRKEEAKKALALKTDIHDLEEEFVRSSTLKKKEKPLFEGIACYQSLWMFSKKSPLRIACYRVVHSDLFENFILVLIMISSFKLALDTYFITDPEDSTQVIASNYIDYGFNVCFTCECLMKVISFGFFMDDGSYLRENWNILDFFIVTSSLIDMSLPTVDIPAIKVLRLLRILRPLRFVSHNLSMKIVVSALLNSVGAIINVVIVMVLIFLMIAILGMSLIGERMGYCAEVKNFYGVNYDTCVNILKKNWQIYQTNFDNIFSAMLTVFILSTQENWPNIMYRAVDSNTSDIGPIQGNYIQISYFFVLALVICNIFLVNLFIGVIFYHFTAAQEAEGGKHSLFLTPEQEKWLEIQKLVPFANPDYQFFMVPSHKINVFFYKIINYKYFDLIIMVCIVFNIVTMALSYETSSTSYNTILDNINYFFTAVFILECILKFLGLGVRGYLYSSWNKFDLFVVLTSIIDILMNNLGQSFLSFLRVGPQLARILRVMRVSRLLKLVKSLKGIQKLLETLTLSLPSLMNVGALVLLVFFIYSVLGVFLFSEVREGTIINDLNNFQNFGMAMILMIRCSTGENWWTVMFDCNKIDPYCTPGVDCGSMFAPLFFITFMVICTFVMLNLFIFVILSEFGKYSTQEENPTQVFKDNLADFRKIWSSLTRPSKGTKLPSKQLIDFFKMLEKPLGLGLECRRELVAREIMKMNLTGDDEGNVYFNELLFAALKRAYGTDIYKDSGVECLQLVAKEEFELSQKIEKIKQKMIKSERMKQRLSSTFHRIRTSLRSSFHKNTNAVYPQDSFKDNELKTTTTNSNAEINTKTKKKGIINPMFAILFLGMTFKAWKSFTTKKQDGLLLSNDSLPPLKNESDDDDWEEDEEESEEDYDEFDEDEQKQYENKALKPRRVGFLNFGEIKEDSNEDSSQSKSKSESQSQSENENENENEELKDQEFHSQTHQNISQRHSVLESYARNERKSILKTPRFSVLTPKGDERRGSKLGSPMLFTPVGGDDRKISRFVEAVKENIQESEDSSNSSESLE